MLTSCCLFIYRLLSQLLRISFFTNPNLRAQVYDIIGIGCPETRRVGTGDFLGTASELPEVMANNEET